MAVEALTKVKLRAECAVRGITEVNELATALGIDVKQLDATLRRDFILRGDAECYKQAREASDGFEHGYLGFDRVFELSRQTRHRMAGYVRAAIFELAGLDENTRSNLLSGDFAKPLGPWRIEKYLRGTLLGEADDLALPGNEYPFIRWRTTIKKCELDDSGKLQIQSEEELTPELAEGVLFSPKSMEMWEPE